jgi:LPS-assembly lipoprotein
MSWSDTCRRRGRTIVFGLAAVLAAGGCTVQPLYGNRAPTTYTAAGSTVAATLAAIAVDPIEGRVGQELRNELVFNLTGGGRPLPAKYRLHVVLSEIASDLAIAPVTGTPTARVLTLSASYRLADARTDETLYSGTSTANASYNRSNQRFANLRAARDAQDRAAAVIAADIRTRLAAVLARRG